MTVDPPSPLDNGAPVLDGPAPGEHRQMFISSQGRDRSFLLSVPEGYTDEVSWPVIFVFHGWQESSRATHDYTGFDAANAIVVYPQGVANAWEPAPYARTAAGEDQAFVRQILDSLRATYPVDRTRVFAAGFSNGGGFAALLGCRMPDVFAGVASVSAAYYRAIHDNCSDDPIALLDIHGTVDPVINYYGGTRHGTPYDPVPDVLAVDAERNRCTGDVATTRVSEAVIEQHWQGCVLPLTHIRLGGGGHVWPGGTADPNMPVPRGFATREILEFFGIPRSTL
ncbi:hypothetical protein A605_07040 [Corynebacterium halotolerans YIM 70093 = DSM 44683]|uniref:Polyhydroxybutyrate depolymerase n=1 Tax=Corynebacterium halotolerans YIM 70093 = DSM 44683 TaxID=1121362 RepID=M1NY33_9CORY|nr:hypothetical protein A605_07040 [Corynebacterium halotolerans YIM 70093 = DSM 44683]